MPDVEQTESNVSEEERVKQDAARLEEYLDGMPKLNIGAFFVPPIWGPAKGMWLTILWYPLWVFADNCMYAWWCLGTPLATVIGVLALVLMVVVTVAFAYFGGIYAAARAIQQGKTKEEFQRGEFRWAIAGALMAVVLLGAATYFNLFVRVPLVV